MGADAMIFFSSDKEEPYFSWGSLISATYKKVDANDNYWAKGANFRVDLTGNDRFYGEGYERGVAPTIVGVFMDLFASPDVKEVWYGSDYQDSLDKITPEDVAKLALHYMKVGNRPYRGQP